MAGNAIGAGLEGGQSRVSACVLFLDMSGGHSGGHSARLHSRGSGFLVASIENDLSISVSLQRHRPWPVHRTVHNLRWRDPSSSFTLREVV